MGDCQARFREKGGVKLPSTYSTGIGRTYSHRKSKLNSYLPTQMKLPEVILVLLQPDDREQFILDNQWAFKYGAQQEFGMRDERCEEGEEAISRKTIEDGLQSREQGRQ